MSRDDKKIYAQGFPPDVSEADVREYFSRCGEINDIFVKESQRGWFAFVGFETFEAVEEALKLDGKEFQNSVLTIQKKGGGNSDKKCFSCGKPGHVASRCPNGTERTCFNCGRVGHISRDCPGPVDRHRRRSESRDSRRSRSRSHSRRHRHRREESKDRHRRHRSYSRRHSRSHSPRR